MREADANVAAQAAFLDARCEVFRSCLRDGAREYEVRHPPPSGCVG
jgi:hypothetical protein